MGRDRDRTPDLRWSASGSSPCAGSSLRRRGVSPPVRLAIGEEATLADLEEVIFVGNSGEDVLGGLAKRVNAVFVPSGDQTGSKQPIERGSENAPPHPRIGS